MYMGKSELQWDKYLKISTVRRDDADADDYRYAYEPTPYPVLGLLANRGYLDKQNFLLDYGCGKGRAVFYLSYFTKCRAIGLEYNIRILNAAKANKASAISGKRTEFVHADAEQYKVPSDVDRFFFFNPFSVEIFRKAYSRILDSWYEKPRKLMLFFYYISDEYLEFIYGHTDLQLADEIDCRDYPIGEPGREKIMVFSLEP